MIPPLEGLASQPAVAVAEASERAASVVANEKKATTKKKTGSTERSGADAGNEQPADG